MSAQPHETHHCVDCDAEITLPHIRAGDPEWPTQFIVSRTGYERLVAVEVAVLRLLASGGFDTFTDQADRAVAALRAALARPAEEERG